MNLTEQAKAKTAEQPTHVLVTSLRTVAEPRNTEERLVRAWIIDALEERYPAASDHVQAAFEAHDAATVAGEEPADVDYVAVLLHAVQVVTTPVSYASLREGRKIQNKHTRENAVITGTANGDVVLEFTTGASQGEPATLAPHEVCQNWINLP